MSSLKKYLGYLCHLINVGKWYDMQIHFCVFSKHDDVIKWKYFPRYWPFVRGIHRSPVKSPHKGQWRRALMFTLICARINDWVNNREAGDLRRHLDHYDVSVMTVHQVTFFQCQTQISLNSTSHCPNCLVILKFENHQWYQINNISRICHVDFRFIHYLFSMDKWWELSHYQKTFIYYGYLIVGYG